MRMSPVSAAFPAPCRPEAAPFPRGARAAALVLAGVLVGCLAPDAPSGADPAPGPAGPAASDVGDAPRAATPEEGAALDRLLADKPIPETPLYPDPLPPSLPKRAHHGDCRVDFDQPSALRLLPDRAGNTFAVWPWYIQGCHGGYAWLHVREYHERQSPDWNHYHLMYERGEFCLPDSGGFGVRVSGTCTAVSDPAREPRQVWSHTGSQWIRVYAYRSGNHAMTFDLKLFQVLGHTPVQVWIRKAADGSWWYWPSLGAATWNPQPWADGIDDIAIRSADGATTTFGLDNFVVHVPYP